MAFDLVRGIAETITLTTLCQNVTGARVARFIAIIESDVDVHIVLKSVSEGAAVPSEGTVTVPQAQAQLYWQELEGRGRYLSLAGSAGGTCRVLLR
jgi:hypothetical protein